MDRALSPEMQKAADEAAAKRGVTNDGDADKAAADKKAADDKAAADKAAADKAAADKAAADADAAAKAIKDGKAADGGGDNKDGKEKKDDDKPKAPAKYELKLGDNSPLGKADQDFIEKISRENDLTNEEAQALLTQQEVYESEKVNGYLAALKADKTYGGEKLADTQRLANALLDKVRPKGTERGDGLRAFLGGAMNNLEVASFLADLGRMTLEDSVVRGGNAEREAPTRQADRMYPNTPDYHGTKS